MTVAKPQDQEAEREAQIASAFMAIWGDPAMSSGPQPIHRRRRQEGPVFRQGPVVILHTREGVEEALSRPEVFSSNMRSARLGNDRPLIPMQIDPPDHHRYRRILDPLFGPKSLAALLPETALVEIADDLIRRLSSSQSCDFVSAFAVPYPAAAFLFLMGLPQTDQRLLIGLKDQIVHPPWGDPAETARLQSQAGGQLYEYFDSKLAELDRDSAKPDCLLTRLLKLQHADVPLTRNEIQDICYLLVLAGLDTVTDTLALSVAFLARNPAEQARLRADPGLIPAAAEELLRWESPVPGVPREVTEDTEIAGCPVARGDLVYVSFGAANTDESTLPDAFDIDLGRSPNRHLAFGAGIHRCLGVWMARTEIRIALQQWHKLLEPYALEPDAELCYLPGLRTLAALPLAFTKA